MVAHPGAPRSGDVSRISKGPTLLGMDRKLLHGAAPLALFSRSFREEDDVRSLSEGPEVDAWEHSSPPLDDERWARSGLRSFAAAVA